MSGRGVREDTGFAHDHPAKVSDFSSVFIEEKVQRVQVQSQADCHIGNGFHASRDWHVGS